jgi:hypothetical protein
MNHVKIMEFNHQSFLLSMGVLLRLVLYIVNWVKVLIFCSLNLALIKPFYDLELNFVTICV